MMNYVKELMMKHTRLLKIGSKKRIRKMKYIRTKETDCCIIDTIKYKEITGEDCFIPKNEIVDKADTIEELCDEFVVVIENKPHLIPREWLKQEIIVDVLYGAIWTEWGLKYVAKMNDKGELELL